MNKSQSKYFNTAERMDEAFLELLDEKDFPYITVKEICQRAGVNRSTFYLHYETINDLLTETIEHMNDELVAYFTDGLEDFPRRINDCSRDELNLVRPEYLIPYLTYIKEHQRVFGTAFKQRVTLQTEETFKRMFEHVFNPVLERYGVPQKDRIFVVSYHLHGLMAIVTTWLEGGCEESIEHISELMQGCVMASISEKDTLVANS